MASEILPKLEVGGSNHRGTFLFITDKRRYFFPFSYGLIQNHDRSLINVKQPA